MLFRTRREQVTAAAGKNRRHRLDIVPVMNRIIGLGAKKAKTRSVVSYPPPPQ